MKETGQKLKSKRETLQITISEAAMSTKINPKIIRSMEEGDLEKLPAKSFLRGFVKSYAQFLKLDEKEIMQSFSEEVGKTQVITPPPTEPQAEAEEAPKLRKGTPISITSKTVAIAGVFVLILGIVIVRKIMEKYERERELPASPAQELSAISPLPAAPTTNLEKPTDTHAQEQKPVPVETPPAQTAQPAQSKPGTNQESNPVLVRAPSPSWQPGANSANGNQNANVKVASPTPATNPSPAPTATKPPAPNAANSTSASATGTPKPLPTAAAPAAPAPAASLPATPVASKPAPVAAAAPAPQSAPKPPPPSATVAATPPKTLPPAAPTPSAAPAPASAPAQSAPPATPPAAAVAKPVELIVEALNTVTLTFLIDNKEKKSITLGPDQVHTIKGKQAVALDLSDGGAVNIIYNGRDRGVPGDLGKPKSLKFP